MGTPDPSPHNDGDIEMSVWALASRDARVNDWLKTLHGLPLPVRDGGTFHPPGIPDERSRRYTVMLD